MRLLADLRPALAMTSEQDAVWLPGQFRKLLHHVPDETNVLRFRHLVLPWSSCGVPTLPWSGPLPRYPFCAECLAEARRHGHENAHPPPLRDHVEGQLRTTVSGHTSASAELSGHQSHGRVATD